MQESHWSPEQTRKPVVDPDFTPASASVDMNAIFGGSGEIAYSDPDPLHPPSGWYAEPSGAPGVLRYWDGSAWTDHRHEIPGRNRLRPSARR